MSEIRITSTELGDAATSETGGQVQVTSFDGGNGIVQSVVAGTNVTVDSTNPAHPIVSATGGGGGGAVASVNGHIGTVVLAASDVGADASGAAAAAIVTAEGYTDAAITGEVSRANAAYDALGAAAAAQAASQPLDSDLTAIAALTTTTFGRALLALADVAALRTTAGLGTAAVSASTDFDAAGAAAAAQAASQPLDSDLTAIAALTTTTYGRAFLALADAAAGRTALALGTAATSASTDFDAAGAAAAAQAASQPLDSDLTAIAALTTTSYGRAFLALADAAAGRTALGLGTAATSASTDFQPIDSDLTAIAALTTTSYGRAFLALADAAAARTALSLGTLATQSGTFSGTSSGTNTGDQTITLTGDVTGTGTGSFATTAVKINGVAVTGTPSVGYVPTATSSSAATWQAAGGSGYDQFPYVGVGGNSYETMPRWLPTGSHNLSTGRLALVAVVLPSGFSVGHISFCSQAAIASPTHWWFGLYDNAFAQLAVTADQTSAAWPGNTLKTLAIATTAGGASSTFTTTYAGLYYVGIMLAGTGSMLAYISGIGTINGTSPAVSGFGATTGMTTPPAFPFTISNAGASGNQVWASVAP